MSQHRDEILKHLRHLVAFDTRNPPRSIPARKGIINYVTKALGKAFKIDIADLGDGCVIVHARRGKPQVLFNVHLDTVPAAEGWVGDPLKLQTKNGRAIGLGACDIKGAAACLLTAASQTKGSAAFLFTTDEEAGSSQCVRTFVENKQAYDTVIVAEPTENKAVAAHRGVITATATFTGIPGHGSSARALQDNAIHQCVEWAAAVVQWAQTAENDSFGVLTGQRFNIGVIEGGTKPNMIAESASVRFGIRPLPGWDAVQVFKKLAKIAPNAKAVTITPGFDGPSLPAGSSPAGREEVVKNVAEKLGLSTADPVDFWTEAAIFSEAGYDAMVLGPGSIEQAHTPDEWVAIDDLEEYAAMCVRLLS